MKSVGIKTIEEIEERVRLCDYLCVAQLYLRSNFALKRELRFDDIKPRLLGHWGTCHGINVAYANLQAMYGDDPGYSFVLGPGHGFPALQANLWVDGELARVDAAATVDAAGLEYLCREFSWPDGFPSHASPYTPGVITEGGELGYALANAYGVALGHPEKTVAVLIGDGELETATAIDSLNLLALLGGEGNGKVLPILHLNGYKISAPSLYARRSERELLQMVRGFGYTPIEVKEEDFQAALREGEKIFGHVPKKVAGDNVVAGESTGAAGENWRGAPFYILKTEKGETGPNRHQMAHQIPLKSPATEVAELKTLEEWLRSYGVEEWLAKLMEQEESTETAEQGGTAEIMGRTKELVEDAQ